MLTQAPLPTWLNLLRALLRRPPPDAILAAPWCRDGEAAGWLSRSAWSLALIALWRKRHAPDSPVRVWIPDFFCNTSLVALRATGAKLVFYSLTDKLAPDITAWTALLDAEPPDLFLLVHYFGRPIPAASTRDFCARKGAWLIEDAAHVLRPADSIGTYGDFVLYSPHKHLPIPTGAVLVVRPNGPAQFGADEVASFGPPSNWPGQLCDLQQSPSCSMNRSRGRAAIWLAKRVLQKLGVRPVHRSTTPYSESLIFDPAASAQLDAPAHSGLARRLLPGLLSDLVAVERQRKRHELLWDALLVNDATSDLVLVSAAERSAERDWTPYLASYRVDPTVAEATSIRWQLNGLPVTTWPDLPPEVIADRGHHMYAWQLRHSRLYLPVHQSLDARAILKQWRLPKIADGSEPHLRLVWDSTTRLQWQAWEARVARSNLMQNWAYGAAKSGDSGWRVKRGVFYRDNEPIAIVQMLQKRVAGILSITRINRGPLCLRALLAQEQHALWKELARFGRLWHGRVLTVAPEMPLCGPSLAFLADLGFRQFSPRAWESAWIDLGLELDVLRKRLDGKWRNMLAFSEKAGLQLDITSDDSAFEWMMARYRELILEKNFTGTPIRLFSRLRKQLDDESQFLILRAVSKGEPVAGICVICHGTTATYLLGWNGHDGRALKANQYLLWRAIMHLQQSGRRWFDLGGLSEEHTPGVAAFKLGLNGERYELVGEYWKW